MITRRGTTPGRDGVGRRGQSSVLGVVLIIGMVLAGTALVVTIGSGALTGVQTQSELERAEHSMTLFNSRAAMAALGDSPTQSVSFGADGGSFETREGDSWLRITHANHTDAGADEEIYNASLGSVVYENHGTEIAYQGGGVWRMDPDGPGRMISPPEFHYRGATLTLPIVRVNDAGGGGGSTAQVSRADGTRHVFPNESASYENSVTKYRNPVANGTVDITLQTPFYRGWAEYFRSSTEGNVTTFPDRERVQVTLVSLAGSIGDFDMPAEGNGIDVRGMGRDHPIQSFDVTLLPDGHYQNMHWSFYADEGNEQLELHFYADDKCSGAGSFDGTIDTSIYYYNSSGSTTIHEEWQNSTVDPTDNPDFDVDCDTGELTIDLLGSTTMAYGDISMTGSDNKWKFGPEIASRSIDGPTTSFGGHTGEPSSFSMDTGTAELGLLVNHYLQLLGPTYDLTVTDGPGGSSRVDESRSTGTLEFYTSEDEQYITYLHVTENEIDVRFR